MLYLRSFLTTALIFLSDLVLSNPISYKVKVRASLGFMNSTFHSHFIKVKGKPLHAPLTLTK
jgi:hypothetical protein